MSANESFSLSENWYVPVPVISKESFCFWFDTNSKDSLDKLQNDFNSFFEIFQKDRDHYDLGIISHIYSKPFILDEADWDNHMKRSVVLKTERFFDPYSPDLGSGRNVILNNFCWKGVGRNNAAARIDYDHSNGYMSLQEALIEIFFDRLLLKTEPELRVPIYAGFKYKEAQTAFIIRSAKVIRCGQVLAVMRQEDKDICISYLTESLSSCSQGEWYEFIVLRLARSLAKGFFHTSATRDNITIDGRLLDNLSMEFIDRDEDLDFCSCQIFVDDEVDQSLLQSNEFDWVKKLKITSMATPVNYLKLQISHLKRVFNILNIPINESKEFEERIVEVSNMNSLFFDIEQNNLDSRVEFILKKLDTATKKGLKIHSYLSSSKKRIFLSIGQRTSKKIHNISDKKIFFHLNQEEIDDKKLIALAQDFLNTATLNK